MYKEKRTERTRGGQGSGFSRSLKAKKEPAAIAVAAGSGNPKNKGIPVRIERGKNTSLFGILQKSRAKSSWLLSRSFFRSLTKAAQRLPVLAASAISAIFSHPQKGNETRSATDGRAARRGFGVTPAYTTQAAKGVIRLAGVNYILTRTDRTNCKTSGRGNPPRAAEKKKRFHDFCASRRGKGLPP